MDISQISDATVQSLIKIGMDAAAPTSVQTIPGSKIPFIIKDGVVKPLPDLIFNEHAERPERIKQSVSVFDVVSFNEYYTLFSDENSRVFADEVKQQVTAILDYHAKGSEAVPRWVQHRSTLNLRPSEEWKRWVAYNNKHQTQQEFAEFLEQNGIDIVTPNPAAIREIVTDLEGTIDVEFGGAQRQADGRTSFKYTETTKTTVSGGKAITVPDQFRISIPAFIGGDRVSMNVLLRYRLKDQKLVFFYTLVRPEQVVRDAFMVCRDAIASELSVVIINGSPQA